VALVATMNRCLQALRRFIGSGDSVHVPAEGQRP